MKNKEFTPKLFTLLRAGISKEQLGKDILAGTIVGIVALPLAIAFAIALLGSIESLLSAVVSDGMIGGKHRSIPKLNRF